MATPIAAFIAAIISAFIGSFGAIYLKKASSDLTFNISYLLNRNLIFGVLFYTVSTAIFLVTLKFGDLSILYPTIATAYIWISIFSQKMLNEKMNAFKWTGIFIIIIGVALLGLGA